MKYVYRIRVVGYSCCIDYEDVERYVVDEAMNMVGGHEDEW